MLGCCLDAHFIFLLGVSSNLGVVYFALAGFGLFRGLYDSNLFAALFDVVPPRYRSSATGLMLAFAFIVGATAPLILGFVKQYSGLGVGLSGHVRGLSRQWPPYSRRNQLLFFP